jgi:elongation factor 1-beta
MSEVIIHFRIMPESPDTDLNDLQKKCEEIISRAGEVGKVEIIPIAFGLKSVNIHAIMDESKGSPDEIEKDLNDLKETSSAEIVDVRRTLDI